MEGLSTLPMMDELQVYSFLMVLLRITGLTVTAPVLGSLGMPFRVRGALAFALSLALYPLTEPLQGEVYLLGAAICELMYGLTKVRYRDYLLGTALGNTPQIVIEVLCADWVLAWIG